jgi:hypothetical protein
MQNGNASKLKRLSPKPMPSLFTYQDQDDDEEENDNVTIVSIVNSKMLKRGGGENDPQQPLS